MPSMPVSREATIPTPTSGGGTPNAAPSPDEAAVKSPPPRVLIVDDEENILSSLRRLLRKEPYELVVVSDPREALCLIEKEPVSLVISDYRMPNMSGTELLFEVQRRWPNTLRIVLSGYSEVKAIISAINEGAVYKFITKPWNDEEIKLHIRRALEQHALEAENRRMAGEINLQNQQLVELNEQLDQRATDASKGLTFAQEILDVIEAGVLMIDDTGLIVSANRQAAQLLASDGECLCGLLAETVLPEALSATALTRKDVPTSGRFMHKQRSLQWRAKPLKGDGEHQGAVIVLWEDI